LLEGTDVLVPPQGGRKHPDAKMVKLNTSNILFICGGAFDGVERLISSRLNQAKIGFKKGDEKDLLDTTNFLQFISPTDLRAFGLIPELIGRLPILVHLDPLDETALLAILTEPKSALLKQYQKLFQLEGIALEFSEDAKKFMVKKAMEFNLGARGLRAICETIITDAMYELPSEPGIKEFTIDKKYCEEKFSKVAVKKLMAA
jgi:ATP-dependent Clp protease ATP-binding subunit ClpX